MKTHGDAKVLREYVRAILREDDYGGFGGEYGGMMGYGVSFGSKSDMINTFITPFVDAFKVGVGKTKELSRKVQTVVGVTIKTLLSIAIPTISQNYMLIFEKEKHDIEKIKGEYSEAMNKIDEAVKSNDAAMLAFLACPEVVLGAFAAKNAPKVVKGFLSTISGGFSDKLYDKIASSAKAVGRWSLGGDKEDVLVSKKNPSDFFGESLLREDEEKLKKKPITPKDVLKSKKMISSVVKSDNVQKMKKDAVETYRKTLRSVLEQAKGTLNAKSIDDIEKHMGKKIPKADEIRKLQGEERTKAEQALVNGVKKAMKEFYVKNLSDHVTSVVSAGIPEETQYVQDYKKVISTIENM